LLCKLPDPFHLENAVEDYPLFDYPEQLSKDEGDDSDGCDPRMRKVLIQSTRRK
jgi:hypothetical protein